MLDLLLAGGTGIDGAKVVSGTESWDSMPKQYSSLTIQSGATVNVTDKIVIIGVSGDCTITGTINANAAAGNGGPLQFVLVRYPGGYRIALGAEEWELKPQTTFPVEMNAAPGPKRCMS